jgi:ankyrin repeat protein
MTDTDKFFQAISSGDPDTIASLLALEPELLFARNARGQSAVLLACYTGRNNIRDLLIRHGGPLQIYEAAAAGQLTRAKELVEKDPSLAKSYSPDGFPVLALAAVFGHFEVAKYLHAQGGDLDAVATNGSAYTALTGSVASGHTEISKWLLENGADANYRYASGYSPLLAAAASGHLEILKALLAHGAELLAKTDDGKNALVHAEERGHQEVAAFLLLQGLTR